MDATQQRIGFDFEDDAVRAAIVRRLLDVERLTIDGRPLSRAAQAGIVELLLRIAVAAPPTADDRTFAVAAQTAWLAGMRRKESDPRLRGGLSTSEKTIQTWSRAAQALGVLTVDYRSREYGGSAWNVWRVDLSAIERLTRDARSVHPTNGARSGPKGSEGVQPGPKGSDLAPTHKENLRPNPSLKETATPFESRPDAGAAAELLALKIAAPGRLLSDAAARGLSAVEAVAEARRAVAAATHPANAKRFRDPLAAAAYRVRVGAWPAGGSAGEVLEGAALDDWASRQAGAKATREDSATWYAAHEWAKRGRREGMAEETIRDQVARRFGAAVADRMVWFCES